MQTKNFLRILSTALCSVLLASCSLKQKKPLIIWTNIAEFASYAESFNAQHDNQKAVVIYKEYPAHSLPPAKNELTPDIVVGSWLKNTSTRKYFLPLDYLFSDSIVHRTDIYQQLNEYGNIMNKQYLIPISFNVPAIVYSSKNEELINSTKQTLSLDEIRSLAGSYNEKNDKDSYINMGYGPSWDSDFMYFVAKTKGTDFREKGTSFSWNQKAMISAISYMREWSASRNIDTTTEQSFQFKYLYMPKARQLTSQRCLFSYMTSDSLFTLTNEQLGELNFKWIANDDKIIVEDSIITMGLYKKSKNVKDAETFISWFMTSKTQEKLLERTASMHLDSQHFGIAGGFSSIKDVNENIYPSYYQQLLGKIPDGSLLSTPNILPYNWPLLKEKVVHPYIKDSINTNSTLKVKTLEERILEWNKQYF
jgi:hypothetical protein